MTAPVLVLTDSISQSSQRTRKYRVLQAQYGDAYEEVVEDGLNATVDTWSMSFENLDGTDRDTLIDFLDTVGGTVWFTATMPGDSVEKKWRVTGDVTEVALAGDVFTIRFTMKQVFVLS